jgi:Cutinase
VRWRAALAAFGLLAAGCASTVAGHGAHPVTCPAVFFGVAGSGQGPENPAPAVVPSGVTAADASRYGTTVALLKTELTRTAGAHLAAATAIDYPALAADRYLGPSGLSPDLDTSELRGVTTLLGAIRRSYRAGCGDRPVLLSGYSQGAEVVIRAVDRLRPAQQHHVTVALFGSPSFRPGTVGDYPAGRTARGLRLTFESTAFTLPSDVRRRTIDICAPGDPVCGVDPAATTLLDRLASVLGHLKIHANAYAFGTEGYAATAAAFLWHHRA